MVSFHNVPQVLAENIYSSVIVYNVTYTFIRSNVFIVFKSSLFLINFYPFDSLVVTDMCYSLPI